MEVHNENEQSISNTALTTEQYSGKEWQQCDLARTALEKYDKAYTMFADHAERELIDVTGADVTLTGRRGRAPKTIWAPLVDESGPVKDYDPRLTRMLDESRVLRDIAIDAHEMARRARRAAHAASSTTLRRN